MESPGCLWCVPGTWIQECIPGGGTKQIHDYTTGQHRLKVLLLFSSVLPSWIVNSGLVRLLWVQGAFQVKMPTGNLEIPTSSLIWNAPLTPSGGLSPLEVDLKVVAPLSITRVINCGSTTSDSSQSVKKGTGQYNEGWNHYETSCGVKYPALSTICLLFSKLCRKLWQRRLRTYTDSTCHSNSIRTYCLEVKAYRVSFNVYTQSFYWFSNGSSTSKRCVLTLIISLHINVPSSK